MAGTVYDIYPTPIVTCGNSGMQYAIYNSSFYNGDKTFSNFDPTVFKKETPVYSNVTSKIGIDVGSLNAQIVSVYNSPKFINSTYFAIDHRGYLFARENGKYTFQSDDADDIVFIWIGNLAYSGWTRSNANLVDVYPNSATFSLTLTEGSYYPLRILFGNAEQIASFNFKISAPDGSIIINSTTVSSPYLVQYACDTELAPEYAAWGAES